MKFQLKKILDVDVNLKTENLQDISIKKKPFMQINVCVLIVSFTLACQYKQRLEIIKCLIFWNGI